MKGPSLQVADQPNFNFPNFSHYLGRFEFNRLFTDVLGWNHPPAAERGWQNDRFKQVEFQRRMVAELSGVVVLEIVADSGWPDENTRMAIWRHLAREHYENLLIFVDKTNTPTQSLWYWVKRSKDAETGKAKVVARRHEYFRGQPADLFASKLKSMVVELSELDDRGRLPVLDVVRRMESALDVERTTKRFFSSYSEQHDKLLEQIEGIADERDRRWYASVILNRLMFVWFLQKKLFLDGGNTDYLQHKLADSKKRGNNRFFGEFLNALFFEAFAKPEPDRSTTAKQLTGKIPYLNGGLFLHHKLELDEQHQPRLGTMLRIPDAAFEGVFKVFAAYTWHLDDTPGGDADEINPDVLGYIFEKYINQKAFGAYYTRPEITSYLAERSIHQLILERIYEPALPELKVAEVKFDSVADLLARMDARIALKLVNEVLPSITVLDPAVGSGAFLVAALKVLINVYYAVVGRAELGASSELQHWLKPIQKHHPSVGYYIKRRIVTDNLYGVDIMEEACEIAKLRLFLAMVSSVRKVEDLEPLPNIDFNILPGNSLVGLMRVDEHEFDAKYKQGDLFRKSFRQLLDKKNRDLANYRSNADALGKDVDLRALRDDIDESMREANAVMNELIQDQFVARGIKYEQATWDDKQAKLGKPVKRKVELADVAAQHPLHWGYVFDDIMQRRGGFDIVLTNPPWEVFKPQAKEFFAEHSELITKNKMTIKEFEKEQAKLLKNKTVREAWLEYEGRFPHMSAWFRASPEYCYQSAVVARKKTGSDINLYKLFTERCFHLLRSGGHCGIVIPSGIYTDLGAKGLRDLLFEHAHIQGLFCFENRKEIFEGVHRSFKFVVLTFEKESGVRELSEARIQNDPIRFPAAFMRLKPEDLVSFPDENSIWLDLNFIRRLSPDSNSIMEFKKPIDIQIAEKLLRFPLLGEAVPRSWNFSLTTEFHMTNDGKHLFETKQIEHSLPVFEGKMIHQFTSELDKPRYWVAEPKGRRHILGNVDDTGQRLPYQHARLVHRAIARSTDERTMIATLIPPCSFYGHSLNGSRNSSNPKLDAYVCAIFNSFVFDYYLRQKVSANLTMFFVYECPVPRLSIDDEQMSLISGLVGQLICSTPSFDELAIALKVQNQQIRASDSNVRARIRAVLDGLVAHLYGISEAEFAHILASFPLVSDPTKIAALNAYRDVARGVLT